MTFEVSFTKTEETPAKNRNEFLLGKIKIGEFEEFFRASLSYWNAEDYLKQWCKALKRVCFEKKASALITTMYNPRYANFIEWWVIYPENECVFFQNQLLFFENLDKDFNENFVYDHIPARERVNDEGIPISEWSSTISEIEAYFEEHCKSS